MTPHDNLLLSPGTLLERSTFALIRHDTDPRELSHMSPYPGGRIEFRAGDIVLMKDHPKEAMTYITGTLYEPREKDTDPYIVDTNHCLTPEGMYTGYGFFERKVQWFEFAAFNLIPIPIRIDNPRRWWYIAKNDWEINEHLTVMNFYGKTK